jgi:uncharacterized protein YdhG (YjbR/CyaY superfamily)
MKNTSDQIPVRTIDEYLTGLPENVIIVLENLRALIRSVVPEVQETISYQIPTFKYHGSLVGFAAFKNHCSFFVMSTETTKAFQEKLKPYKTALATIHFTPEKPLPESLILAIVKARMLENEESANKRKSR